MTEETQNLVQEEMPTETVVETGDRQSRVVTCNKKTTMSLLSVFVALLIAGQAVSVYFISQQQSTINQLSDTTTALKLKDMVKNLPGSPPSQPRQKLRMAEFSIPLAFSDSDGSQQNLEAKAEESNKIEDAVKFMLLRTNPLRTYQSFNGTMLENLRMLKKTLSDQEWMVFDAWMQQWYLFFLVQNPEKPAGAAVTSDCTEQAAKAQKMPGTYVPQCDEKGDYEVKQCWQSTGFCWCVDKNGTEIEGSASRRPIDCEKYADMAKQE